MKVNNSLSKARWESIPCDCGTDIMNSYPIKECLHCKFDECWKSVPQKNFKVKEHETKDGKMTGKLIEKEIKELTLVRGTKYQDVVGWIW